MRVLLVAAVLVAGCGPYGLSQTGRACDAGAGSQHCASPTTYAACVTSDGFSSWREFGCAESCVEGGKCALGASKATTECPSSWQGVTVCKAPQLAISCVDGAWLPRTCDECPAGSTCFACQCSSASSLAGYPCDSTKDASICEVDGRATTCSRGIWQAYTCNACRAGKPLTNCDQRTGVCPCD